MKKYINLTKKDILEDIYSELVTLTKFYQAQGSILQYRKHFLKLLRKYFILLTLSQQKSSENLPESFCVSNCYLYALDLPMPSSFVELYNSLSAGPFKLFPGELSGLSVVHKPLSNLEFCTRITCDLNTLGIEHFNVDKDAKPTHGGYKMACFLGDKGIDGHFARQEESGIWTHQKGYGGEIDVMDEKDFGYYHNGLIGYDYVKTLELVKPSFKNKSK